MMGPIPIHDFGPQIDSTDRPKRDREEKNQQPRGRRAKSGATAPENKAAASDNDPAARRPESDGITGTLVDLEA